MKEKVTPVKGDLNLISRIKNAGTEAEKNSEFHVTS